MSFIADALCSTPTNKKGFFSLLDDSDIFDDILDAPQLSSDIQAHPTKTQMSPYLPYIRRVPALSPTKRE